MRSKGWRNAARLMERWFSLPAAVAPAYGPADTATLRMDTWVLTFPRARRLFDQLVADRIWANLAAQGEIAAMLRRKELLAGNPTSFGNLLTPANLQDSDYINQRVVSFGLMDLDDMSAALGRFAFRILVSGLVEGDTSGRGHRVTIDVSVSTCGTPTTSTAISSSAIGMTPITQ